MGPKHQVPGTRAILEIIVIRNEERSLLNPGIMSYHRKFSDDLMFLPLRDSTGTIQLVLKGSDQDKTKLRQNLQDLTAESVICAEGRIVARDAGTINLKMATGEIEVDLTSVTVLNKTHKSLPFLPSNQAVVRG